MNIALSLLLQVVLIALNAIFACAEIAVISMNEAKVEKLVSEGNKKAKKLSKLKAQPAKFLATIQIAITLAGFLGSAFAADNFSAPLVDLLVSAGIANEVNRAVFQKISVVLITLVLSYFTLVLGELVPKRLAMKKAEKLALGMSGMLYGISKIFAPMVWLLTASTNGVLRLFGVDPNEVDEEVSEEDIRLMVDAGSETGAIDIEEKEMIQNVFEFDDLSIEEFATHRTDVTFLWTDDSLEEWEKTIAASSYTSYPVCGETADDIVGILNTKEYFRLSDRSRESIMENAVKPAFFVPITLRADVLFKQMKEAKTHIAVVLDEYGGVFGIVTMNDILEQIVGDFNSDDPSEEEEAPEIESIGENVWRISGTAPIDEVNEMLSLDLPTDEYDTFGGFVFGSYGSVPSDGVEFTIDVDVLHIEVTEIKEHRIENAIVTRTEPIQEETEDE